MAGAAVASVLLGSSQCNNTATSEQLPPTKEPNPTEIPTNTAVSTSTLTSTEVVTSTPVPTRTATTETVTREVKTVDANVVETTPQGWAILELKQEDIDFLAGSEIVHGDTGRQAVALTFDAGSDGSPWPTIRETLLRIPAKMTVFLTGNFINCYPVYVQEMVDFGLEIGNHSVTNPDFTKISEQEIKDEILGCQKALDGALGYHLPMRFFRFPYGARNSQTMRAVARYGLQSVFWSDGGDSHGWMKVGEEEVLKRLTAGMRPGQIFVQHIGSQEDALSLEKYLQALAGNNYQVLPISEIAAEESKPPSIISAESQFPEVKFAFQLPL